MLGTLNCLLGGDEGSRKKRQELKAFREKVKEHNNNAGGTMAPSEERDLALADYIGEVDRSDLPKRFPEETDGGGARVDKGTMGRGPWRRPGAAGTGS